MSKYWKFYHPQTHVQLEPYNRTVVRQLRVCVAEDPKEWDGYISLLTTAYNTPVPTSTGQAPLLFVSPRRLRTLGIERLPKLRPEREREELGDDKDSDPLGEASRYVGELKGILPKVRKHLRKAQEAYKRNVDASVAEKSKDLHVGDWVLMASHARKRSRLAHKSVGPYKVLKIDGRRFTIKSPEGIRTVNSDYIMRAPAPQEGHPAWMRAEAIRQNYENTAPSKGSLNEAEYVFETFVGHRYKADGSLELWVRWFGYGPEGDTWTVSTGLPAEAVGKYCKRKK